MAVSMPHGEIYNPAKFHELTGARRAHRHDPDHTLASALEYAKYKTGHDMDAIGGAEGGTGMNTRVSVARNMLVSIPHC